MLTDFIILKMVYVLVETIGNNLLSAYKDFKVAYSNLIMHLLLFQKSKIRKDSFIMPNIFGAQ